MTKALDRCDVLSVCVVKTEKTCIIVIRGVAMGTTFDLKIALAREHAARACWCAHLQKCLSLEKKKRVLKLAVEMT